MSVLSRRSLIVEGACSGLSLGLFSSGAALAASASVHVLIWLRGGADALNLVVPFQDTAYYRARPHIAIAQPGRGSDAALTLTPTLGIHPRLAPIRAWFERGEASWVLGVGGSELVRSHSVAERSVEFALRARWGEAACWRAPGSLAEQLVQLARRIRGGDAPAVAVVDAWGWDTHAAQGGGRGAFAVLVGELVAALQPFRDGLGDARARVRIMVFSEFGRSVPETPLAGTDDGYASAALLIGGPRFATPVRGSWPALGPDSLEKGRYLRPALTLDALLDGWRGDSRT